MCPPRRAAATFGIICVNPAVEAGKFKDAIVSFEDIVAALERTVGLKLSVVQDPTVLMCSDSQIGPFSRGEGVTFLGLTCK